MPELPEVEYGRKLAHTAGIGRRITRVHCDDDEIVFAGIAPREMEAALTGRTIVQTRRRGKYIWLELDRRPWPCFHFGMTGAFRVKGQLPLQLEASPKVPDMSWPPRFTKIQIIFDDGGELVMTNSRRLGRIRLLEDPRAEPPISSLGFDPQDEMPDLKEFRQLIGARKGTLKGLLLNQSFAAGVGNWIADEVLYQAGLDPRRPANTLTHDETKRFHHKLKHVIETAVRVDAHKDRFPKTWLFHHRWGKQADITTARGEPIEHMVVAGRTTAWVPSAQS